jgi:hypothetical protein
MRWDVAPRQRIARLTRHDGPIVDGAVRPDGSVIARRQDGIVKLWDHRPAIGRRTLRPDRRCRYERIDITGLAEVSAVQTMMVTTLGAGERSPCQRLTQAETPTSTFRINNCGPAQAAVHDGGEGLSRLRQRIDAGDVNPRLAPFQ